jgi:uncharacterized protein with HEPN domain
MPRDDAARLGDIIEACDRMAHPDVPWSDMAGMRDIVIHQYFGVDAKLVWRAASVSVPRVVGQLRGLPPNAHTPPDA